MLRHTSRLKRTFDGATGILRSQHKNKISTDKQIRDRLFHVVTKTKIQTQRRKVLSLHTKLGRDTKMSSRQKVLSRHKNLATTENSYNTNRLCRNIKMKLQQEIELSEDKTLS